MSQLSTVTVTAVGLNKAGTGESEEKPDSFITVQQEDGGH